MGSRLFQMELPRSMNLSRFMKVVRPTKAPLKTDALQTLRDHSGAGLLAKRLECVWLQHRFWSAHGHGHAT